MIIRKRYALIRRQYEELLVHYYRYSEFDGLRKNLIRTFPLSEAAIPELPRKSVVCTSSLTFPREVQRLTG